MKTILFAGIAAAGLLFTPAGANAGDSTAHANHKSQTKYSEPEYGPAIRADAQAYKWSEEGNAAFAAPGGSSYSYDGAWDGEYVDPQGRVFEGEWQGTVTRHDGVSGPGHHAGPQHHKQAGAPYPAPHHAAPAYDPDSENYRVPQGYEGYERCLKSNGLSGAAIGAVLGGIAGNRIAGRGERLGGTVLGAGLGGLAGAAIEKATAKCNRYEPRYQQQPQAYYPPHSYGWQGGYYYYPQAPMVTVTVFPATTTTTVTEEVYYETVHVKPRKPAARKWKPKPKPRCICR